jgi:hypothetical protein
MATGYTAAIADGISFPTFALQCARAFGALVMMRDDPSDAPIPEQFAPSNYHANALIDLQATMVRLDGMSHEQAAEAATADYNHACEYRKARIAEKEALRTKYEAMLAQVQAWPVPTPDHVGLKDFMVTQIEQSIEWDCKVYPEEAPRQFSGAEWLSNQIAETRRLIAYHEKEDREERERTATRNAWVKALRDSLAA